jgi:HK97 family phage prohead protease
VLDSDSDVIVQGAFTKSLQERGVNSKGRRIQHLRHHDWQQPIGKFLSLEQDSYGLKFVSKMSESTIGKDALINYDEGIINEHSIGFNYIKGKIEKKESADFGEYYEVKEVRLLEGSAVTFGANEHTGTISVNKSLSLEDNLEKLNNEMNILVKALRNGKGTDERLESFENTLKQIQQKYISLIELKSFDKDTFLGESSNEEEAQKALQLKAEQDEQLKKLLLKNLIN